MGAPTHTIKSPVDGRIFQEVPYLNEAEAFERLGLAERAAREFRASAVSARRLLCLRFLDAFESELETNALAVTQMMGKPIKQSRGEFGGMKQRTRALCDLAETALADETIAGSDGIERTIRREPLGVVLDIAAWNYPWLVAVNVVVPAVLAGNAVLLKHAPQTALAGAQFARAFERAGAPIGLVQDFFVDHALAGRVLTSGRLGYVGFTGSVAGGKAVFSEAARGGLLRSGLELGGKDAALVLPDADLTSTVENLVDGAFYNAGQSCCAVERIYVPRASCDEFVARFAELTRKYVLDSPLAETTTLGPVVDERAAARNLAQVEEALAQGGRLVVGPGDFVVPDASPCYLAPHVVVDAPQSSRLMQEESFGPVIGILPYDTLAEGLRLVNDSPYGLTASIWTTDLDRAAALGTELEVGTVFANRADFVDPELPWSGVKHSGLGCTLSRHGLLALTRPKSFHLRKSPHS